MKISLIRPLRNLTRGPNWRQGGFATALVLGWVGALSGSVAVAQECSIEALGQISYARAKQKVEEQFGGKDDFAIESYEKTEITIEPDCIFILHGRFQFRVKNQAKHKTYDAKMTPKDDAPNGMQILLWEINNG